MQQREPVRHDICCVELCITVYAEFRINGTEVRAAAGLALRKHPHLPDNTKVHPASASLAGFKCSPDHAVPKLLTGGRLT